jgi:hypothetical protein
MFHVEQSRDESAASDRSGTRHEDSLSRELSEACCRISGLRSPGKAKGL